MSSETSLHWALSKFAEHTPSSHNSSADHALLTSLIRSPLPNVARNPRPIGPSPALARQLSACVSAAHRLRDACAVTGRFNHNESKMLIETWDAAHVKQARAWAEDVFASVRAAVETAKSPSSHIKQEKPVFHHEYTPLLEKYFEHNAYPSAPDRTLLARKTMMSPRQIEVWFQNHRNRAKKEGRHLRRLADRQPLPTEITCELSVESLERETSNSILPRREWRPPKPVEPHMTPVDESIVRLSSPTSSATSLDPPSPPYAFPTAYSAHKMNPLKSPDKIYTFPPPVWQRTPAVPSQSPKYDVDMNVFIHDFNQKLHFRGPVVNHHYSSSQSWCTGRSTIPFSAPLPSLVRYPNQPTVLSHTIQRPSKNSFLSSSYHAFQCAASHSLVTSVPSQEPGISPARKISQLPRRKPRNPSVVSRCSNPTPLVTSPTPSSSSSRSSSSSSASKRHSSSSGTSPTSSVLSTPDQSYANLPKDVCSFSDASLFLKLLPLSSTA